MFGEGVHIIELQLSVNALAYPVRIDITFPSTPRGPSSIALFDIRANSRLRRLLQSPTNDQQANMHRMVQLTVPAIELAYWSIAFRLYVACLLHSIAFFGTDRNWVLCSELVWVGMPEVGISSAL
jgi:hypothetical protein